MWSFVDWKTLSVNDELVVVTTELVSLLLILSDVLFNCFVIDNDELLATCILSLTTISKVLTLLGISISLVKPMENWEKKKIIDFKKSMKKNLFL